MFVFTLVQSLLLETEAKLNLSATFINAMQNNKWAIGFQESVTVHFSS